jgi:hypothetical protein
MLIVNCILARKVESVGHMDSTIAWSMNANRILPSWLVVS